MVPVTPTKSPPKVLALQHVIDHVLGIPEECPIKSAFPAFWIFTIFDLMSINVKEDLTGDFIHSDLDEDSHVIETTHCLPPMLPRIVQTRYLHRETNWISTTVGGE